MTTYFSDLITDLESRIEDEFEDLYEYPRQREDKLVELAEEQVPESYTKLAELLVSDLSLADGDPDTLGDNLTVWAIIQSALRQKLVSAAMEEYKHQEELYDEMKDTLEGMGYQSGVTARQPPDGKRRWYIYWEDAEGREVIVCNGFKSEMEAWKWFDLNEEQLSPTMKAPESK